MHESHALTDYALVLAAGDGRRLERLTTDASGRPVPKQYCSLDGRESLLEETVRRARALVGPARVTAIVAAAHRTWWRRDLAALPAANLFVQPENRGTAIGLLLPALHLAHRDRHARLVVLPSDHHVDDPIALEGAVRRALAASDAHPGELVLVGVAPEEADPELGYVVPAPGPGPARVARFVEKPDAGLAERLVAGGALWNSFILVAPAHALLVMFRARIPEVVVALEAALAADEWRTVGGWETAVCYRGLPAVDFSKSILEGAEARLRVIDAPRCGWTDLGTPARLARCVSRRAPAIAPVPVAPAPGPLRIDLGRAAAAAVAA